MMEVFSNKGAGFIMSMPLIGILFKIQRWPSLGLIILVSMFGCFAIAVFSFIKKKNEECGKIYPE